LVVAVDGSEAHGAVEAKGGRHGVGHGVEVHGGIAPVARDGDDGVGELAAEAGPLLGGADPEALHFAGAFIEAGRLIELQRLEGNASGGDFVFEGEEDGAGGFGIAAGEGGEFFFEALDANVLAANGVVEEAGVFAHEDPAEFGVVRWAAEFCRPDGEHTGMIPAAVTGALRGNLWFGSRVSRPG
jgi:hypothetical protein